MKNNESAPETSAPPPPYVFVPPPIPFYSPPPPHWSAYPTPWPVPPPHGFHMSMLPYPHQTVGSTAPDSGQLGPHVPPSPPPPYGMWPPPPGAGAVTRVYPPPHILMASFIPPTGVSPNVGQAELQVAPPADVVQFMGSGATRVSLAMQQAASVPGPVVPLPTSPQTSLVDDPSDQTPGPPHITPKSVVQESDESGKPEQAVSPSSKGSQTRRVKSNKHKDVEEKKSPGQEKLEENVLDEQKCPKEGVSAAETSEEEENSAALPKLGSEPYVGLRFYSEDEAYEFYNAYAKEKGFSIRKSHIQRSRVDHSVISREYVCANQGFRSTNDRRYKGKVVRPRRETRVNCRAAMSIKRRSQRWIVDRFHKEHNHGLVDPTKAEKLRSHRKITSTTKQVIDILYKCRIGPSKIIDVLEKAASGDNNVEIGSLDLIKYMKKERKNNIGLDCYSVLGYFQRIQSLESGFFYAVEVGENRSMRSVFWADNRAREAYKLFGDVIVFDTPFSSNKDLFPFASFTGLNHHRQAVLYCCGFLADETVESYIWLFKTFLNAMSNKYPTSVITVRDKAIVVAVEKVFQKARHRFCMLHFEKNELENLNGVFNMNPDFQTEFKRCIYSSRKPEEFESDWRALLVKYGLKDNSWLSGIYDQRHHWVPVYLQDTFFAGMTRRRMDQGMNYFDGFIHDGTDLPEFISQYELAVKRRREEEADEDFMTMYTSAGPASKSEIEEQAARVYTRNVFTIFSQELYESSECTVKKMGNELGNRYIVGKFEDEMNVVIFHSEDNNVTCTCHMFEFEGLLCRHVLKVFQELNVVEIPPKYILKRWTMSGRSVGLCNTEAGGSLKDPTVNILTLKETAIKFIELGLSCGESINKAISIIDEGMQKISLVNVPTSCSPPEDMDCNSFPGEKTNSATSQEHRPVETENHSASSKMKSEINQAYKKKRKCSICNKTGHYTSSCPKGSSFESQTSTSVSSTL